MAPFVPVPARVREIDRELRGVERRRRAARAVLADALLLLAHLDAETDALLALRSAEAARSR